MCCSVLCSTGVTFPEITLMLRYFMFLSSLSVGIKFRLEKSEILYVHINRLYPLVLS